MPGSLSSLQRAPFCAEWTRYNTSTVHPSLAVWLISSSFHKYLSLSVHSLKTNKTNTAQLDGYHWRLALLLVWKENWWTLRVIGPVGVIIISVQISFFLLTSGQNMAFNKVRDRWFLLLLLTCLFPFVFCWYGLLLLCFLFWGWGVGGIWIKQSWMYHHKVCMDIMWVFICVIINMQYWWLMHWLWQKTGALQIGHHKGPIQPGDVYSGGQWNINCQMKCCFFNNSLLTKNVFREGKKRTQRWKAKK